VQAAKLLPLHNTKAANSKHGLISCLLALCSAGEADVAAGSDIQSNISSADPAVAAAAAISCQA
jgi:hypothetical protein